LEGGRYGTGGIGQARFLPVLTIAVLLLAVNMYRSREMWDDAYRVAKTHGGGNASQQVDRAHPTPRIPNPAYV
jgi:hypothetical protein